MAQSILQVNLQPASFCLTGLAKDTMTHCVCVCLFFFCLEVCHFDQKTADDKLLTVSEMHYAALDLPGMSWIKVTALLSVLHQHFHLHFPHIGFSMHVNLPPYFAQHFQSLRVQGSE